MTKFFSAERSGFFDDAIHGPREIAGELSARERKAGKRPPMVPNPDCTLPIDAVEITEKRYSELMAAQAEGKRIVFRGTAVFAVEREPDAAGLQAARRRKRDRLLAGSDWTQLPDSPLDPETRSIWANYRTALRDLDMSGTEWPVMPAPAR